MSIFNKIGNVLKKIDSVIDKADKISTEKCCALEKAITRNSKTFNENISDRVPIVVNKVKGSIPIVREKVSRAKDSVVSASDTVKAKTMAAKTKTSDVVKCVPTKIKTISTGVVVSTVSTVVVDAIKLSYQFIKQVAMPTCYMTIVKVVRRKGYTS